MSVIIYYLLLILIVVPTYTISEVFRDKNNRIGIYICYFMLFVILLLFV